MDSVLKLVQPARIRDFLQELTKEPHLAGSRRDRCMQAPCSEFASSGRELASWIEAEWEEAGLDSVTRDHYNFLLSYPNSSRPNKVLHSGRDVLSATDLPGGCRGQGSVHQ